MTKLIVEKYNPNELPDDINVQADEPHLHCAFIVRSEDITIARLCLYINSNITYNNQQCLLIGNMYIANGGKDGFTLLLESAYTEAKNLNLNTIIGPINGSTWSEYRLPKKGNTPCFLGDLNYPLTYVESLREAGFKECHKYYSSIAPAKHVDIHTQTEQLNDQGVSIRSIDLECYEAELKQLYPVCIEAFKQNEFFTPISEVEFINAYLPYKSILRSDYTLIAEDNSGVVGFIFCYIDETVAEKSLVIKTIARHPERTYRALVDAMAKTVVNNAVTAGINSVIHAFMHEQNKSYVLSDKFGGKVIREYALFLKTI